MQPFCCQLEHFSLKSLGAGLFWCPGLVILVFDNSSSLLKPISYHPTIEGHTYERQGSDVVESFRGPDGKLRTHTDHGVSKFVLSTEDGDDHGKFKSVNLEASS